MLCSYAFVCLSLGTLLTMYRYYRVLLFTQRTHTLTLTHTPNTLIIIIVFFFSCCCCRSILYSTGHNRMYHGMCAIAQSYSCTHCAQFSSKWALIVAVVVVVVSKTIYRAMPSHYLHPCSHSWSYTRLYMEYGSTCGVAFSWLPPNYELLVGKQIWLPLDFSCAPTEDD